jgi:hypothetical protein
MKIWIAIITQVIPMEQPKHHEPVIIETFLSGEECWQYAGSDAMTDKAREMGLIEPGKYYSLGCKQVELLAPNPSEEER